MTLRFMMAASAQTFSMRRGKAGLERCHRVACGIRLRITGSALWAPLLQRTCATFARCECHAGLAACYPSRRIPSFRHNACGCPFSYLLGPCTIGSAALSWNVPGVSLDSLG